TKKKVTAKKTKTHRETAAKKSAAAASTKKKGNGAAEKVPRKKPVRLLTGKSLLVVESPAKARTIKKYLGSAFVVKASVGHIKDLPKSKMGVDPKKRFKPTYVVIRNKAKIISEIR